MTLEQKVAAKALELITTVRSAGNEPSLSETEYRAHTEGLPALLRSCGLSRTLAFLNARNETQKLIASHLEIQLRNTCMLDAKTGLQQYVAECSLPEYRVCSKLTMLIALWQKRIAQARLRPKPKEKEKQS